MPKNFYHNITQQKFNIQDRMDLMSDYKEKDLLMKSEFGCALLNQVTEEELEELILEYEEYV